MALKATLKDVEFGVGDKIKVLQRIKEAGKERFQSFEGMVISIRGSGENKTFTLRKIGAAAIGIERIFPLASPTIEKIDITRKGTKGVRHAKLYFIRGKSRREIEKIYSRTSRKVANQTVSAKKKQSGKIRKSSGKPPKETQKK